MKSSRVIIIFFGIFCISCSKKHYYPIYYKDYNILINYNNLNNNKKLKILQSGKFRYGDSLLVKLKLLNRVGKAKIIVRNSQNITLIKGFYGSNATLSDHVFQIKDIKTGELWDYSFEHYKPFKTGKWSFFDAKGNQLREEYWRNDSLISR